MDPLGCANALTLSLDPTYMKDLCVFFHSISIWLRLSTGGRRRTRTMSSLFSWTPRYEADHKVCFFPLRLWSVRNECVPAVLQGAAVSTATCLQLHKRAEKIAAALTEKGSINTGENVVLLYPPSESCCRFPVACIGFSGISFYSTFACPLFPRHWFDRRLLRLPLRWMRSCERQTSAPPEPCRHPAHCPHDNRCMPLYSFADAHTLFRTDGFCFSGQ